MSLLLLISEFSFLSVFYFHWNLRQCDGQLHRDVRVLGDSWAYGGALSHGAGLQLQQDLPAHCLRNNFHSGDHWQRISHCCGGLPEEGQNHDRQVPLPSLRGRPPVCAHAAFLGRRCSQQLVLRQLPLCVRAHDLLSQPVQQRADSGLHQPGPIPGGCAGHQQPSHKKAACLQSDLRGRVAACGAVNHTRPGVCSGAELRLLKHRLQQGRHGNCRVQVDLSAHLPRRHQPDMDRCIPLPTHPGGLHTARSGHSHLLLYHHCQVVAGRQGPGAEEESAEDHGHPHPLLLLLLAALLRGHLSGHPDHAERGPLLILWAAAGGGEVDLHHRGPGLLPLLPQPHPLRFPGSEV